MERQLVDAHQENEVLQQRYGALIAENARTSQEAHVSYEVESAISAQRGHEAIELQNKLVQSRTEMDEAMFAIVGRDLQLDQMKAEFIENKQCDEARFYELAANHVNHVNGEHQQNFT